MLNFEQTQILEQAIVLLFRLRDDQAIENWEVKRTREFEKQNIGFNETQSAFAKILKEIKRMPQKFKEIFNREWFEKHLRKKSNGIYEIRCTINHVAYSGAGKTVDVAAENFIKSIAVSKKNSKQQNVTRNILFNDFAENWFKKVKKSTLKSRTYKNYYNAYSVHLRPFFEKKLLTQITAMTIQPLFTSFLKKKKKKAILDAKTLLNQIFKCAIGERIIQFNPMQNVQVLKLYSEEGKPLTITEEKKFLADIKNHVYKLSFLILLFTGMRRGELSSAVIENGFIVVHKNKLRLGQPDKIKKIPITPMLAPYLESVSKTEFKQAVNITPDVLTRNFKKICPEHHLHELRHTFITRCQECGVPLEVVTYLAGHAADNTQTSKVYTRFSDEFLLKIGKQINYQQRLI